MTPKQMFMVGFNLVLLGAVVVVGARVIEKLANKVPG